VSAEDFSRRKRRIVLKWAGAGLLIVLIVVFVYLRSTKAVDGQKAVDDGEQMLKANRYTEAIQSFDRALALNSGLVNAYLLRGRANVGLSQLEPAIRDFTKVTQLRPNSPDAFLERASARLALTEYQEVIADCGEVLSRDPKLAYAYTLRGRAFRETGNFPKSLEDFNRAVELSPGLDTYFQRASSYASMGEHKMAIADLDRVIDLYPTSPMGYLARAKSREAIGDLGGARDDREQGRLLERRLPGQ
jgi:tetratricopeptide (TPR) repeat protein